MSVFFLEVMWKNEATLVDVDCVRHLCCIYFTLGMGHVHNVFPQNM